MQRWIKAAIAAAALAATTGIAQADEHRGHDSRATHDSWRGHDGGRDSRGSHDNRSSHDYRGRNDYRSGNDYRGGRDSWRGHESWHPVAPRGGVRYGYSGYGAQGWRSGGYHPYARGGYLPRAYFGPRYVVRDYGYYGLRAPPLGYGWVRVNNDFLLAALATGFVADVLFGGY